MRRLLWINIPGLSASLARQCPALVSRLRSMQAIVPPTPAVTCTVQATLTTGAAPSEHGIVANGLFTRRLRRDLAEVDLTSHAEYRREVSFWEQSNRLLDRPRFWHGLSKPDGSAVRTAMLFWQQSMPGFAGEQTPAADIVLTPKPRHLPDGTVSHVWSSPESLHGNLSARMGPFPLMNYWGPLAGLPATRWIADAAKYVWQHGDGGQRPDLQLVYLPLLDYAPQKFGPEHPSTHADLLAVGELAGELIDLARADEAECMVIGEYGIAAVSHGVQPNRLLAEAGLLQTREQDAAGIPGVAVDYARSPAFAMVDHQIAHVYCDSNMTVARVQELFANVPGVDRVLGRHELDAFGLHHERAGDVVLLADPQAWFAYYWADPATMPAWARTVDIHAKPGYDPLELFFVPPERRVSWDLTQIHGSHGAPNEQAAGVIATTADAELPTQMIAVPNFVSRLMAWTGQSA